MTGNKTDSSLDAPLFISVTGHADIPSKDFQFIESELDKLFTMLRTKYPDTRLVLISGMCQGADIIVSEFALKKGLHVAPVLPMSLEKYRKTFSSEDYLHRMEVILENENTYSPFVIETDSDDERDSYTNLSAFLIFNSSVMISLWDGRSYERNGGTFDTMRMAYEGVDTSVMQNYSRTVSGTASDIPFRLKYLDSAEDCLIYRIPVSRESSDEELIGKGCKNPNEIKQGCGFIVPIVVQSDGAEPDIMSPKVIPSDTIPPMYDSAFARMDEFNRDVKNHLNSHSGVSCIDADSDSDYECDSCFYLLSAKSDSVKKTIEKVKKSPTMNLTAERYHMADVLALRDQSSTFRMIRAIILVTALSGFFFSLFILMNGSVLINVIYTVLMIGGTALIYLHNRKGDYLRFIEYRALAESMRVEYYRTLMGVRRLIPNSCYGYMKNELLWTNTVLKSWNTPFMNDYGSLPVLSDDEIISLVNECWVDDQMNYHEKTKNRNRAKLTKNKNEAKILSVTTTVISGLLAASTMFFEEFMDGSVASVGGLVLFGVRMVPVLNVDITFIVRALLVVLVALSTYVMTSAILIHGGTPEQIESKRQMFVIAKLRMMKSDSKIQREILLELGDQCIAEMNDWVYEHRMKDYKSGVAKTSLMDVDSK